MTLQEWMRALDRKDHSWASRVDLSLLLDMKSFDLTALAPIDTSLSSLRGRVTGEVRVTGTAGAPVLGMHATASSFSYHGVESASAEGVGRYASQRLTVERLISRATARPRMSRGRSRSTSLSTENTGSCANHRSR